MSTSTENSSGSSEQARKTFVDSGSQTETPADNFYSKLVFKVFRFILKILLSIGIISMIFLMSILKIGNFIIFLAAMTYIVCLFYNFIWIPIAVVVFLVTTVLNAFVKVGLDKLEATSFK